MADLFRNDGEYSGEVLEPQNLGKKQLCREAVENSLVGVDDTASLIKSSRDGGVVRGDLGRDGFEGRLVPVLVSGENRGFDVVLDANNEGFGPLCN